VNQQIALTNLPTATRALYDEYAGMLLGYIYEVVKDRNMAEQYLITVFNELPQHLHDVVKPGVSSYLRLQLIARKMLAGFFETIPACTPDNAKSLLPSKPNKFLDRMSEEQQLVFCSVHYSGKSISTLAAELDKPEEVIKKILQQAFAAIRRAAA
jgi:hypothetical protein